jgi:hypothetical protein
MEILLRTSMELGGLLLRDEMRSNGSPTGHEVEDEHDDGQNEKDMNPSSERIAADKTYDPEDEENNGDCPKHFRSPR